jgi:hypothetical protein
MPIIAAVPASVPVMTAPPVAKPVTRPGGDIYEMSNRLNRQVALKQHVDHTIEWALEALRENDDRDAGLSEALAIITHAAPRFERLGGLAS